MTNLEAPPQPSPTHDAITAIFAHFPAGYRPARAPGWRAVVQWVVRGGADQTVIVEDGAARVEAGLTGTPTCTVRTDAETLLGLLRGELEPTAAFMSGRAVADDLGELMKMASAFDFAKAAAAWRAEGGGAGPSDAPDPVDVAFARLPAGFLPERAGDFAATLHFALRDGKNKTVRIGGGRVAVEDGLRGAATCTIRTDAETITGIFHDRIDAQRAWTRGKIKADDVEVLAHFARVFRFDDRTAAPTAPRIWPIGKVWDGGVVYVRPEDAAAYAAATNDANLAYFAPEPIAPPMFHVRLFKALTLQLVTDPALGLDLLRLLHGEHDATFHQPLRPWDAVAVRVTLDDVAEKSSGLLVTAGFEGRVGDALAVEGHTRYFIRRADKAAGRGAQPPEAGPPPDFSAPVVVDPDQSRRYAEASLDRNPLHLDPATARAAGLPDIILHGLCTMAMSGRAVLDAIGDGDPRRLRRLAVRFAAPVHNGVTLTVRGWQTDTGARFVVEDERGAAVITNGLAELR